ncbi:MAG: hypothetical protein QNJ68_07920 [Microcoleaceae cyanobacterium MO_207.B10]|nr:hypothetical protein [Microcoleaceae cyanobacterium MO_207.B10]
MNEQLSDIEIARIRLEAVFAVEEALEVLANKEKLAQKGKRAKMIIYLFSLPLMLPLSIIALAGALIGILAVLPAYAATSVIISVLEEEDE